MLTREAFLKEITPLVPRPTDIRPRGNVRSGIKCLLLDVYGTLLISASGDIGVSKNDSANTQKLKALIHKFGIQQSPESLLNDFFAAIEKEHHYLRKTGTDYPEIRIEEIWKQVLDFARLDQAKTFAVEFEMIANPIYPMPYLKEMLEACIQKKVILGVISNAQFYTPLIMKWFLEGDLEDWGFDPGLMIYSYKLRQAKPSLALYDLAVSRLKKKGIRENTVLYMGNDMLNDIYPAHTVGFNTALFAGDARSLRLRTKDPRCTHLSPDLIVTELLQILDHL